MERSQSDSSHVVLRNVNLATSARYRCEVSAEAPLFNTVSQSRRLVVVAMPTAGPRISGQAVSLYRHPTQNIVVLVAKRRLSVLMEEDE